MEMKTERIKKLENTLDEIYEHLKILRKETITCLGNKDALHIIDFHANNWIDIVRWISSKYKREEQKIVYFQFSRLFKEICWLQFLFHNGNYPMVYRNLRYILELISQAYFIDQKYPNLSLDEQIEKTKETEEEVYAWNLVQSVLCNILTDEEIKTNIKPLWNYLNKNVHPSAKQMNGVAIEDFSSLMTDSFNEKLARDALCTTNEIFDIVNMILFKKFPRIKKLAREYEFINEWEEYFPYTMRIIKEKSVENK